MRNLSNLRLVGATLTVSLVAAVSSAHAQVKTFTGQNSFLNNVSTGAYEEGFNSFANQVVASPQAFSFGGFSYTLSAGAGQSIYYSDGGGTEGSVFPSVQTATDSFVITFTSGNVTAVGGTFFESDINYTELAGISVTATLATGQSLVLASTNNYDTEPFGGFTSNVPITSLTLTAPATTSSGAAAFLSLDNLYVGRSTYASVVPEPTTWAMLTLGGGVLAVLGLRRRLGGSPSA